MNPDIEHLIALQQLDSATQEGRLRLAREPEREKALEERLEALRRQVADARERLTASQSLRREVEKELAVHQGRLSKFRDQLMAVKTNHEYQAMQKEIGFAQAEIRTMEDKILERMLESDDLGGLVKRAEAELAAEQRAVEAERQAIAADHAATESALEKMAAEREELARAIDPHVLAIFTQVSGRRHGIGVAEARGGICTICHVRLRPQVFNTVRRNEQIIQCESCHRILYFVPAPAHAADNVSQPAP